VRLTAPILPPWLEDQLPAGIERTCVATAGGAMHVMQLGSGRPVLMLHGNPTWGFLYRRVAEELRGVGLRLVLPDLIGLGLSDKPRDAAVHTLDNHAAWLGELIDALALDGLIFVGQDWGGPIGLRALAERADRVAGMVLLNTVVGEPRPNFRPTSFHRFARIPALSDATFKLLGFPQGALWLAQGDRRSIRGEIARAYRYPLRRLRDRIAPLALARMVPNSHDHASIPALIRGRELFERFEGPVEVVWGDRDPVLGRARTRIERLRPDANVTRTAAGHFLQEEVPELIADAVKRAARALGD
jgi:cis-3-alkyl-4-acyloxetan-2-one decarboxylase